MLVVDHAYVLAELVNSAMANGWIGDPVRDVEVRVLEKLGISVGNMQRAGREMTREMTGTKSKN